MGSMDARSQTAFRRRLTSTLSAALVAVVLVLIGRAFSRPETATAQNPVKRGGKRPAAESSSVRPAAPAPTARNGQATSSAGRPSAGNGPAGPAGPAAGPTAGPTPPTGPAQPPQMAVVNGQPISREQLAHACLSRYGEQVLESIVNRHLIWQACQQQNVAITEGDVESEIQQMAGKFGLSVDRWLEMLQQERDISPDKYRREIIWPTLALRRLAAGQLTVSEQEVAEAFEAEFGPKVRVRLISVSSRDKAESLRQQATAHPEKFGDLAKDHSEDAATASSRGMVPPISRHMGNADLEQAAFGLKEGEISPVLHVANQYLILQCEKHLPEQYVAGQQLQAIKTQLADQLRDQKLRTAAGELFQKLQQQSQVVNVLNDPQRRQQMPGVAATINGKPITLQQLGDECLARHGKEVLDGEINRVILEQALSKRSKSVTREQLDEEIARAADAYGYLRPDGSPDVQAWLKAVTENDGVNTDLYVQDAVWPSVALKQLIQESIVVSDDDLQKGFQANYGERVETLAIVLANQRQANQVWEMARNNPTDQFFGELAQQYSVEPVSRANYGKVPPLRRFGGQPVLEEEAFRLQPGELSGILVIGDKYVILRCLGRTEPVVQDFAAVQAELHKDIHEKKLRLAMAQEFDRLKESSQIDNFLAGSAQSGKPVKTAAAPNPVAPAGFAAPPTGSRPPAGSRSPLPKR